MTVEAIVPIELEFAFQIRMEFKERIRIDTPNGYRAYVPPAAGTIEGPRLQGRVVPYSGGDYLSNGRLDARYMLEGSDGSMIYITNTGYLRPLDGTPAKRPGEGGNWGHKEPIYFRLTPYFEAPLESPHNWLNNTVIVGTGQRFTDPDYSIFNYYAVL